MMRERPLSGPEQADKVEEQPDFIRDFEKVVEKPDIHVDISEISDVLTDPDRRQHCFEETKKAFEYELNHSDIQILLSEPSRDSFRHLKKIRRLGLILRAQYIYFDSHHLTPEPLRKFLSVLGKFNDRYFLENDPKQAEEIAALYSDVLKEDLAFEASSTEGYQEQVATRLARIEEFFSRPELGSVEFHSLRKEIRFLADSLQIVALDHFGQPLHWLFSSLLELSIRLGQDHDDLVQRGLQGEIDYAGSSIQPDRSVAEKFRLLEPFIKKAAGIES
ncbi:MAG: hypothetical protein ACM3KM_02685 [Acidobacteriaceae bacterium]